MPGVKVFVVSAVKVVCGERCPYIAISVHPNTVALGFRDIWRLVSLVYVI